MRFVPIQRRDVPITDAAWLGHAPKSLLSDFPCDPRPVESGRVGAAFDPGPAASVKTEWVKFSSLADGLESQMAELRDDESVNNKILDGLVSCPVTGEDLFCICGVWYPQWIQEAAVQRMQSTMSLRPGDVVIVSHFPISGLQRMLVSLVRGQKDPWAKGLLDPPYLLEGAASRRGVDEYLEEIDSWQGRRCFKTHALPRGLPCQTPFGAQVEGIAPKIVVLIADPRYALTIFWEFLPIILKHKGKIRKDFMSLPSFIEAVVERRFQLFGDYFAHAEAWAKEAAANPGQVRLFVVDRFASADPGEVKAACEELARFLEVSEPGKAASELVTSMMRRPMDASVALGQDIISSRDAIDGGPLIELLGPRLQNFENALAEISSEFRNQFRKMLFSWMDGSDACLAQLAHVAARGVCSLPPARMLQPLKGEGAHASNECRVCVFALRGACQNSAEMCKYCHADGHERTKRASRAKRAQRKVRDHTRSPSPGQAQDVLATRTRWQTG